MSCRKIDRTGQRYERLVALEAVGQKLNRGYLWRCRCDCGNEIVTYGSRLANGRTRSCGCIRLEKRRARPMKDPLLRFWSYVEKTDTCWIWKGSTISDGYGWFYAGGGRKAHPKMVLAHRFLYELNFGPIPEGLDLCHHCDNPPCVRLDHLFVGTRADNMQDCRRKGRLRPRGVLFHVSE